MNRIFLLEDDKEIQRMLKEYLEKNKFSLEIFSNAESLYVFLRKEKPDLILLDLMLPDADGVEVCKYLKSKEEYEKIPIIIISAKTEEMDRVIGLEIGADDYANLFF